MAFCMASVYDLVAQMYTFHGLCIHREEGEQKRLAPKKNCKECRKRF